MLRKIVFGVLSVAAIGGAVLGVHSLRPAPIRLDPALPSAPVVPADTGTLMLTLQLDAGQGIQVLQALGKPQLGFQQARNWQRLPLQWQLLDPAGQLLARGGFDPHRICLDPAHAGQPPHMDGDQVVPHVAHFNLKIPALAGADRIEFRWVGEVDQPALRSRPLGAVSIPSLTIR